MKLDQVKLAAVFERVDALSERIDYALSRRMDMQPIVRRGDAWDEAQHPRGPDGKFVEGAGAAGAAAAEYVSQQQKSGKKATPNGMMQHLLLNGGITKQEIWDATKANFEMAPNLNNYVSAVAATMKKKGMTVPDPPKAPKGGGPASASTGQNPIINALKALPKPSNQKEIDIEWMATSEVYSTKEKLEEIEGLKVPPESQPYKDQTLAALKLGIDKSSAPAAAVPTLTESGSALDLPSLSDPDSNNQQEMLWLAQDAATSATDKIAQLFHKQAGLSDAADKQYASALMKALSEAAAKQPAPPSSGAAAAPAAPMPKPPAKPLAETEALTGELADLQQKWMGMTAKNKLPVDDIALKLNKALGLPSGDEQSQALSKITPIAYPAGMGQQSANTFLAKVQAAAGLTPTTANAPMNMPATNSLPQGAGKNLQSEIYKDAKDAPSVYLETFGKFDGADGKIRARNLIDTDKIPGNQYAKITAAYGNDRADAMTQAVDKAMAEYQDHSINKLSRDDLDAVHVYQGSGYGAINNAMLSGTSGGPKTAARIKRIKNVINNSVIPCDTPVFRGLKCSLKDLSGFDDPAKSVGRAFAHKNFASVSRSAKTSSFFGDQVTLKMVLPAGTKGLVMAGQAGGEREIMLNANSVFRIDKVEQIANASGKSAKHVVHVTYMGTREDA